MRRAGILIAACALGGVAAHAQTVVPRPLPARPIVVVPGTVTPVTPVPVENWGAIAYHRSTGAFGYSFEGLFTLDELKKNINTFSGIVARSFPGTSQRLFSK